MFTNAKPWLSRNQRQNVDLLEPGMPVMRSSLAFIRGHLTDPGYEREGIVAGDGPKSGAAPKLDRGHLLHSYVFEWRFSAQLTHR